MFKFETLSRVRIKNHTHIFRLHIAHIGSVKCERTKWWCVWYVVMCIVYIRIFYSSIATVVCMLSVLKSMHDFVVVGSGGCLFLFLLFSSHCFLPLSHVV